MSMTIRTKNFAFEWTHQAAMRPHGLGFMALAREEPDPDRNVNTAALEYCTADYFEEGFDFDVGVGD
ncbi:MAG: hypothetical protein HYX68_08355 [Planctomycetes bacterium]|jgi:hypothetical protein|nr:hypothetical protein [Planctomycetota bacterium]